jgi:hypothetical protein
MARRLTFLARDTKPAPNLYSEGDLIHDTPRRFGL